MRVSFAGKAFVLMIALGALLGTGCNKTLPNDGENVKTVTDESA
jgi:hypothetical protein